MALKDRLMTTFSPREIVSELDRYIVGQNDAKRAVAIALRNRRLALASGSSSSRHRTVHLRESKIALARTVCRELNRLRAFTRSLISFSARGGQFVLQVLTPPLFALNLQDRRDERL